jgi:hypothetical protein
MRADRVLFWITAFAFVANATGGCAPSSDLACRHLGTGGATDLCADYQAGFSNDDVRATCLAEDGFVVGAGPCEPGFAECMVDLDGRILTQHYYPPLDMASARRACQGIGGTLDPP